MSNEKIQKIIRGLEDRIQRTKGLKLGAMAMANHQTKALIENMTNSMIELMQDIVTDLNVVIKD